MTNLHVNLVSTEHNGNVFTDTLEITVPVRDILVCNTGRDVEHDDTALALDVISITQSTELLLASGIPDIEADRAKVRWECERVHLDTESGLISGTIAGQKTKSIWKNMEQVNTHQCTSSRIHRSSGAEWRKKRSARNQEIGEAAAYLHESGFASTTITNYIWSPIDMRV